MSDLGRGSPTGLNPVLGDEGSRPDAKDSVAHDFSMGARVVDCDPIFLVVVNNVTHDSGGARCRLCPSSHLNCHTVLATAERLVPDLRYVVSKDVG